MSVGSSIRLWSRRVLPWLTAVALLAYVLHIVSLERLWSSLRGVGAAGVLSLTTAYFVYSFAADVLATYATFRWFCARLSLWDVVAIRGATYLLAIVNYNLGQGAIVYVVGRKRNVGLSRATGTVLLTMGMMFVDLLALVALGSFLSHEADTRLTLMRWISATGLSAFVVYLGVIRLRPAFLVRSRVLQPLFDAGAVGHLKAGLVRFPHVAGHVVFQWALLHLFHVRIPFAAAAVLLPVIFVIGWVPVTVQGLGTQQVAAMELLSRYADASTTAEQQAAVVAFSLTQAAVFVLLGLLTGFVFLRSAASARTAAEIPASPASPDGGTL
jgi:hypothetical protein